MFFPGFFIGKRLQVFVRFNDGTVYLLGYGKRFLYVVYQSVIRFLLYRIRADAYYPIIVREEVVIEANVFRLADGIMKFVKGVLTASIWKCKKTSVARTL